MAHAREQPSLASSDTDQGSTQAEDVDAMKRMERMMQEIASLRRDVDRHGSEMASLRWDLNTNKAR